MKIAWLSDISAVDTGLAGLKSTVLADLYHAKFPVPPAFILTTEVYQAFLRHSELNRLIAQEFSSLDVQNTANLHKTAAKVQQLIADAPLPPGLSAELQEAYENLNVDKDLFERAGKQALDIIKAGRDLPLVAVRNSLAPPSPPASHQIAYVNVRGLGALLKAVRQCWASLFTASAITARVQHGLPPHEASTAVIIQKMVRSDKSGVIFTINPYTLNGDEMVIEAGFGLGEAVVSSSIMPAQYLLSKTTGEVLQRDPHQQEWQYLLDPHLGYTIQKPLTEELKVRDVLSDQELKRLWELSKKVEDHFGHPQDIEYALEGNQAFVIQSRAFSTLKSPSRKKAPPEKSETAEPSSSPPLCEERPETVTEIKAVLQTVEEAEQALQAGADSVGLLRGESFLPSLPAHPWKMVRNDRREEFIGFLVDKIGPVAELFRKRSVWYRTLDASSLDLRQIDGEEEREANPLLGWRGIRRDLEEPEVLRAQFEAIKRLHDQGYTNIGVIIPFITDVEQVKRVKEHLRDFELEPQENIDFGIMIETPAAIQVIRELCEEGLDFVSIGINDLTQLTLAVDGLNPHLQPFYNELHPSLLRQIQAVVKTCREYNIETSVAGHRSAKPDLVEFLVKVGIDSISVAPDAINPIRTLVAKTEKKLLLSAARKEFRI